MGGVGSGRRRPGGEEDRQVCAKLSPKAYRGLSQLAHDRGSSMAQILRDLVTYELERSRKRARP